MRRRAILWTKSSLLKNSSGIIKSMAKESKVNAMARLEFELHYCDVEIQLVNHYATDTLPIIIVNNHFLSNSFLGYLNPKHPGYQRKKEKKKRDETRQDKKRSEKERKKERKGRS